MDENELKSLIDSTLNNTGQKSRIHEMDDNGKQYVHALAKHCADTKTKFPYSSAFKICKDKFNFKGSLDAFRRAVIKVEANELTL
jgi:hypothetical protein